MATRDVVIRFLGNASGLNDAAEQGERAVGKFSDRTQKMATAGLAGVAAFGAGMVSMLKGGVEGLQEGEEAEAKFTQAIGKAPKALQAQTDAIMANAEAIQAKTRFSYEDALAANTMLVANDGVQKAVAAQVVSMEDLTKTSLDLAQVQGIDAAKAAGVLGKAMASPEKAAGLLKKAGVVLDAQTQKQLKTWVENGRTANAQALIYDRLREKVDGAAEAAGDTTAGKLERANAAWGEVQESLAQQVIPALTKLVAWLLKVTKWMQDNPGKVKAIVIVLGSLAVVVGTVSVAIKAWTALTKAQAAAQALLNAVMRANPAVRIALIILALGAALVVVWKKSETFRRIVKGAFDAVKNAASAVWNWIKTNWPLLLAIITGPIGLAVLAIVKNWDKIKAGATAVKNWIVEKFDAVVGFIKGIPGKITSAASGMFDGIKNAFKSAINWIIGAWNGLRFGIPEIDTHIPGIGKVGGGSFGVPQIPYLASGGTVTRRGWAMVGERGPELLRLDRGAEVRPLDAAGGDALSVHIHATGPTLQDIVRVEVREANRRTRTAVVAGARRGHI